jgi:hypothetical protein
MQILLQPVVVRATPFAFNALAPDDTPWDRATEALSDWLAGKQRPWQFVRVE